MRKQRTARMRMVVHNNSADAATRLSQTATLSLEQLLISYDSSTTEMLDQQRRIARVVGVCTVVLEQLMVIGGYSRRIIKKEK